jgi:hypothetical protein
VRQVLRHAVGGAPAVDADRVRRAARHVTGQLGGEQPVPLQQVGESPVGIGRPGPEGLPGPGSCEGGPPEGGDGQQPHAVPRGGQVRPHQPGEQPEPLGDDDPVVRQPSEVVEHQVETLPVERPSRSLCSPIEASELYTRTP